MISARDDDGKRLITAVKSGPTFRQFPTRVPDYSFYGSLLSYVRARAWAVPGHGDFSLRLEEFVLGKDGRWGPYAGAGGGLVLGLVGGLCWGWWVAAWIAGQGRQVEGRWGWWAGAGMATGPWDGVWWVLCG